MSDRSKRSKCLSATLAILLAPALVAQAQVLDEDFDSVSGSGGGVFFYGLGYGETGISGWDDNLAGEGAFGATVGNVHAALSAQGNPTGGVGGTGAGEIAVTGITLNLLDEDLHTVTGTGGGVFLAGDGVTPDTSDFSLNWDDGVFGEAAFAGTYGGAILVGEVSARGCLDCGSNGSGGGELVVGLVDSNGTGAWYAGLQWDVPGFVPGSGPVLFNSSFDRFGESLEPWIGTGNVIVAPVTPRSGTNALKIFGQFIGVPNVTEAYQDVAPAQEGQTWELECYARHNDLTGNPLGDYLRDGCFAEMKIAFYDGSDTLLSSNGVVILDENDPRDQYFHRGPIQATAPAGTVKARAVIAYTQYLDAGGAVLIDDVSFRAVDADYSSFFSQLSLTADVKASALADVVDPTGVDLADYAKFQACFSGPGGGVPAGCESTDFDVDADIDLDDFDVFMIDFGINPLADHYQLRIEDPDGDRLVFTGTADGTFQSVGGPLNTAVEQNAEQVNSNGAFNPGSDSFRVVVAFDNEQTPTWGPGGRLHVDNLVLTNTSASSGDDYYAALLWEDLPAPPVSDMNQLQLTADIKGSVAGGSYQLRLEGFNAVPCINEDFETITSNGETEIAGPNDTGGTFYDWHDQAQYEASVFGIVNGVVTSSGGVWVRGLPTAGNGGGGAAQVEVKDVQVDPDVGLWWAGLVWENQTLGSTNLADIHLTADVKGTWVSAWIQDAGEYMLRIEDAEGDYLAFVETATGAWQTGVGGPLTDADTSGAAGGGDGVFDLDTNGLYKVVVVFEGRMSGPFTIENWGWGGTLTVDNVQLTPCGQPHPLEAGVVAFTGTANGSSFQPVGGLLANADISTFFGEGGVFWDETEQNFGVPAWDSGIEGEDAFAGYWGAGLLGTASAQGCTNCGESGGGGGWYDWTGAGTGGAGGWWVGVAWRPVMAFSNPNQVRLVGDFKADWETGEGQTPGYIYFKIESSANNMRQFPIPATATTNGWYHVDDTLNNADPVGTLVYDGTEREYALVISCYGIDPIEDWGTGGTVYFDNIQLIVSGQTLIDEDFETATGPTLTGLLNYEGNELDYYTVVVSMEEGMATWGEGGGALTVDNLTFESLP